MRRPDVVTVTSVAPAASGQKTPRGSSTTCPLASRMISGRRGPSESIPRRAATNRATRGFDEANARSVGTALSHVADHNTHWSSGRKTPV